MALGVSPSPAHAATAGAATRERLLELLVGTSVPAPASIAEARAARSLADDDPALQSLTFSVECRSMLRQSDVAAANVACERALALAGDADPLARFAAERTTGALLIERGEPLAALPRLIEAHAAAVRSDNAVAVAAALASIGAAAQFAGANGDAVEYYARALAAAPRGGAHGLRAQVANNLGILLLESGDPAAALEQFVAAIDAANLSPTPFDPIAARLGLVMAEIEGGRAEEAVPRLRALVDSHPAARTTAQFAEAQLYLARAELLVGRHAEAEAAARAAAATLRENRPLRAYPALALLVDILVAAGRLDEAERLGDPLLALLPEDARGRVQLLEARERLFAARGRYRDAYREALEARRVRALQATARAANSLAFLRARTAAEERSVALARARADAERERVVRDLVLALLAATLAAILVIWRVERARRRLAAEVEHRRGVDALGQLTAGVAHDFNNLMTIVQQSMGLLRRDPALAASSTSRELIAEAEGAARTGATITRQLLAFARRQPLQPETFEVAPFLEGRRPLLTRALGPSMRLSFELEDAAVRVRVDPGQLATALINLLTNARDAMQERGEVTLRLESAINGRRAKRWPDLPPGRYAVLSIADRGTGMTPELSRKALLPFFTTKPADRGAGLGLSSVIGFATQSRGTLQIDSTPGVGTVVRLVLPSP